MLRTSTIHKHLREKYPAVEWQVSGHDNMVEIRGLFYFIGPTGGHVRVTCIRCYTRPWPSARRVVDIAVDDMALYLAKKMLGWQG